MSYERRKFKTGRVVSDKMDRTVVVQVEWRSPHRLYKKPIRRMSKFMVHDPENISMVGDIVQVIESRPRSKTKRWRLVKVLQRSEMVDIRPEDIGEDVQPAAAVSEPVAKPVSVPEDVVDAVTGPEDAAPVDDEDTVEDAEAEIGEADQDMEPVAEVESELDAEDTMEDTEPSAEAEIDEPDQDTEPVAEVESELDAENTMEDAEPSAEVEIDEPEEDAEPVAEAESDADTDDDGAGAEDESEGESSEDTQPETEPSADSDVETSSELQPDADAPSEGADGKTETETR